ncbi:unnamed protein product [Absidia cylindrospora]
MQGCTGRKQHERNARDTGHWTDSLLLFGFLALIWIAYYVSAGVGVCYSGTRYNCWFVMGNRVNDMYALESPRQQEQQQATTAAAQSEQTDSESTRQQENLEEVHQPSGGHPPTYRSLIHTHKKQQQLT